MATRRPHLHCFLLPSLLLACGSTTVEADGDAPNDAGVGGTRMATDGSPGEAGGSAGEAGSGGSPPAGGGDAASAEGGTGDGTGAGGTMASGGSAGTGTGGGSPDGGACTSDDECASGHCEVGSERCVQCNASAHCAAGAACIDNTCTAPATCVNSLDCPTNLVCDSDAMTCVECLSEADCDGDAICSSNRCLATCDSDRDCTPMGLLCDTRVGQCVAPPGCTASAGVYFLIDTYNIDTTNFSYYQDVASALRTVSQAAVDRGISVGMEIVEPLCNSTEDEPIALPFTRDMAEIHSTIDVLEQWFLGGRSEIFSAFLRVADSLDGAGNPAAISLVAITQKNAEFEDGCGVQFSQAVAVASDLFALNPPNRTYAVPVFGGYADAIEPLAMAGGTGTALRVYLGMNTFEADVTAALQTVVDDLSVCP